MAQEHPDERDHDAAEGCLHEREAVRFDPRTQPHHHLVCTSCGAVTDLDADVELGPALERARGMGAQTSGAEVIVRGLCADCAG